MEVEAGSTSAGVSVGRTIVGDEAGILVAVGWTIVWDEAAGCVAAGTTFFWAEAGEPNISRST